MCSFVYSCRFVQCIFMSPSADVLQELASLDRVWWRYGCMYNIGNIWAGYNRFPYSQLTEPCTHTLLNQTHTHLHISTPHARMHMRLGRIQDCQKGEVHAAGENDGQPWNRRPLPPPHTRRSPPPTPLHPLATHNYKGLHVEIYHVNLQCLDALNSRPR